MLLYKKKFFSDKKKKMHGKRTWDTCVGTLFLNTKEFHQGRIFDFVFQYLSNLEGHQYLPFVTFTHRKFLNMWSNAVRLVKDPE